MVQKKGVLGGIRRVGMSCRRWELGRRKGIELFKGGQVLRQR
jgi:hypothetical protein